ncbi:MAG: right-handed parallel beta-helix repeat-containing protein [Lentisphaerae bacterium]|nr:right-handed parallel beta-helix repeat-containing protein [Lentisphaerota bacterium]
MKNATNHRLFHVAANGNDAWSGRLAVPNAMGADGPWATPAGARDGLRRLRAQGQAGDGPLTVVVHDGMYALTGTLTFGPEDSGTAEAPVRFVAADGATAVISGGRRITGWIETEHAGQRCWVAELPDVASGKWMFTRLYVNNSPRSRPRLPKKGFYRFSGLAGHVHTGTRWGQGPDRAEFASGDIQRWHNWQDVKLVSYQLWFDTHHRLTSIDTEKGIAHFEGRSLGSLRDERGEFARYFVENVFEALDAPGEWYLDRVQGKLYYLPLEGETLNTAVIIAPALETLVQLDGTDDRQVEHLHFENLTFAHQHWELPKGCTGYIQAAFGVPGAVILAGAAHCAFYRCTFTHLNGYGIEVLRGSTENVLAACVICDTGAGGIKIGHEVLHVHEPAVGEDIEGDAPVIATTVVDCTIRDCGHIFPSAIGIWVGNSGWNRLLHNRIFNCKYTGISCGWIWGYGPSRTVANRIEYNHIHHINDHEDLSDNGGIYTLGQQPGTTLIGNRIHDISCYGYGAWGIYPDEGSSEMRVEDNLVYGTRKSAYAIHYGRDNLVQNNIFALSREDHLNLGKWERHRSALFRRNVVLAANGRVRGGNHLQRLAHYTMSQNLYWSLDGTPFTFNGTSLQEQQVLGQHTNAVVADPLFADVEGGDFSLRPDSPAREIGFKPFDWQAAGPRFSDEVPRTYAEYLDAMPLPVREIPVIQTRIEPTKGSIESGQLTFAVTLENLGRASGVGRIELATGPAGVADAPSTTHIDYDLVPGAETTVHVVVPVNPAAGAKAAWLESDSADDLTVPARGLVFPESLGRFVALAVESMQTADEVDALLAASPVVDVLDGNRRVAEIRFGASADSLLLHAHFHERDLRPNLEQPWSGTCIELLVLEPREPDASVSQERLKCQLCLVPSTDGKAVSALLFKDKDTATLVKSVKTMSRASTTGCELGAVIPWDVIGFSSRPAEFDFNLLVDCVDAGTGRIRQIFAFDMPSDGASRPPGKLVVRNA